MGGFALASSFVDAFPNDVEEGRPSWELFRSFYKSLESVQAKLLPCLRIATKLLKRTGSARNFEEVTWHSLSDCLFRTSKMKDPQALDLLMRLNVPLPVFSQPNRDFLDLERRDQGERDRERGSKASAIDERNKSLRGTLQKLSIPFRELSPTTVLEFLSQTKDQSFFPIGSRIGATLPANISQTVTNSDEVTSLLNYIVGLNKTDSQIDVNNMPLLLTQDQVLQRFSKVQELYGNRWHWLLPNKKSLFISHGFTEIKLSKDFLQELTIQIVQKYLQQRNISQKDYGKLSYDLLCFIKSTYKQDKHGSLEDYTKKLGNLQLFPVSRDGQLDYWSFDEVNQVLFPVCQLCPGLAHAGA